MTRTWWQSLTYHLSGRARLERAVPVPKVQPMDLPPIEGPTAQKPTPESTVEKIYLDEKKRLQDVELARLKAIAMGKDKWRDP